MFKLNQDISLLNPAFFPHPCLCPCVPTPSASLFFCSKVILILDPIRCFLTRVGSLLTQAGVAFSSTSPVPRYPFSPSSLLLAPPPPDNFRSAPDSSSGCNLLPGNSLPPPYFNLDFRVRVLPFCFPPPYESSAPPQYLFQGFLVLLVLLCFCLLWGLVFLGVFFLVVLCSWGVFFFLFFFGFFLCFWGWFWFFFLGFFFLFFFF